MDYDSYRAAACSDAGKDFLRQAGLPQSATLAVLKYGDHACSVLRRYWVSRMSFLHGLAAQRQAGQADAFNQASLATFMEPAEFLELLADSPPHVVAHAKQLRALCPQ